MEMSRIFRLFVESRPTLLLKLGSIVMLVMIGILASDGTLIAQSQFSIVGDPTFLVDNLPSEMQTWHERLWGAINHPNEYPDPDELAGSNDTYKLGRQFNDYISALMAAFRATGDLSLLDEADRLMEIARGQLKDTNGDGYLNWLWKHEPSSEYYNKDTHRMDEAMTHSLVAMMAYALKSNASFKSKYAEHAQFWGDYMENHYIPKWEKRGGTNNTLTHPNVSEMRMYYYLFKLTGKSSYLEEAKKREDRLAEHFQTSPDVNAAYIWTHRISTTDPLGWQPVNYAHYVMNFIEDLAMEGVGRFKSDSYMEHFAATWRDLVYTDGTSTMSDLIDGSGSRGFSIYNNAGLARWDKTQKLFELNEKAYQENKIHVPAYMLMVLSDRICSCDGSNIPPKAKITTDVFGGEAPLTVNFSAIESTDPDGIIQTFEWDFGDGQHSNEQLPAPHTYDQLGDYLVILTVMDDSGAVDTDQITISAIAAGSFSYQYIEAENGDITAPMQIGNDKSASSNAYIYTPAGTGNTTTPEPEAIYQVDLDNSGTYYLWVCKYAPSPHNDATYVGFNGTYERTFPEHTNIYEWAKVGETYDLISGANQINIGHAEEQARVDRILITNDPNFVPPAPDSLPTAAVTLSDPSPTKAGTVKVNLITSKIVTSAPTHLLFTDSENSDTIITISESIPGITFTGILIVNDGIADGPGHFSLPSDALTDENGNHGNSITSGAKIWIDKTPPSKPQALEAVFQ